jgi:hypothetical protein
VAVPIHAANGILIEPEPLRMLIPSRRGSSKSETENSGLLVLPATMRIAFNDGTKARHDDPRGNLDSAGGHTFTLNSALPIANVTIDPDHHLPDRDRSNNSWSAP